MADPDFEDLTADSGISDLVNSLAGVTNAIGGLGASLSPPAGSTASVVAGGAIPSMTAMTNAAASINASVASLGGAIGSLNANMQGAKRGRGRGGNNPVNPPPNNPPPNNPPPNNPGGNNQGGTNQGGNNQGGGRGGGGGDGGGGGAGGFVIAVLKVITDLFTKSLSLYQSLDASILARGYTNELQYKAIMSLRGSLSELSKVTQNKVLEAALKTGLERNFIGVSKVLGRADAVGLNINQMAEDIRAYSNTMLLSTGEQARVTNELDKLAFNFRSSTDKLISAMRDLADRMPVQALTGQTAIMEGLAKIQAMTGERLSDPTFVAKTFVPLITGGFNNALKEYLVGAPMLQESLVGKSAEEVANYILSIIKYAEEAPAANIVLDPRNTRMVQSSEMYKEAADTIYRMQQIRQALEDVPLIREMKTPEISDVQNSFINVTNELQHAIYTVTEGFTALGKTVNQLVIRIASFTTLVSTLGLALFPAVKDMFGGGIDGIINSILTKLGLGGLTGLTGAGIYEMIKGRLTGGVARGAATRGAATAAAGAATRRAAMALATRKALAVLGKIAAKAVGWGAITGGISLLLLTPDIIEGYEIYEAINSLMDPDAFSDPEKIQKIKNFLMDELDPSELTPEEVTGLKEIGLLDQDAFNNLPPKQTTIGEYLLPPSLQNADSMTKARYLSAMRDAEKRGYPVQRVPTPQIIPEETKPSLPDISGSQPKSFEGMPIPPINPVSPIPMPPTAPSPQGPKEEEKEMTAEDMAESIQKQLKDLGLSEFEPLKDAALIDAVLKNQDGRTETLNVLDLIQRNTGDTSRYLKEQNEERSRIEPTSYQARDLLMRQAALIGESFARMSTMDALMRKAEVSDERYQLALEANSYLKNTSDYLKTLNEKVTRPTNPGLRDRDRIGR